MQVAEAMHVGTSVQKRSHRFKWTTARSEMKRKRVVTDVTLVGICTVLEQQAERLRVMHGDMKSCRAIVAFVNKRRLAGKVFAQLPDISRRACREESLDRRCCRALHGLRIYPTGTSDWRCVAGRKGLLDSLVDHGFTRRVTTPGNDQARQCRETSRGERRSSRNHKATPSVARRQQHNARNDQAQ